MVMASRQDQKMSVIPGMLGLGVESLSCILMNWFTEKYVLISDAKCL